MSERENLLSKLRDRYKPDGKKTDNGKTPSKFTVTQYGYGVVEKPTPCQVQRYLEEQKRLNKD